MSLVLPIVEVRTRQARPASLVDAFLEEQQRLSAVERFADLPASALHRTGRLRYRNLLPASPPGPGQQYRFEVDLDACSGCQSCVAACHSLNGLDDDESWRQVGLLVGGTTASPVVQHVTSACHHCLEPACLEGCPVIAYEKDPNTGIVKHLDDQCIGCQYCILKCPYDVPRYNQRLGIVRKCDMCSHRLTVGEAPACAQSCPNQAIRITLVDTQHVIDSAEADTFVPGAAEPDYTFPTTSYLTRRALPRNLLPADHRAIHPHDAHTPLAVMLVLTQLSVGGFLVLDWLPRMENRDSAGTSESLHSLFALGFGLLALGASILHLGRPLYAFRAVIGLRTSWLSREIVAFSIFALLSSIYAAAVCLRPGPARPLHLEILRCAVAGSGLLGVVSSIMVYHDTRRPCWHAVWTGAKFTMSMVTLGLAAALISVSIRSADPAGPASLCRWLAVASTLKMSYELLILLHLRSRVFRPLKRSALLLAGPLRRCQGARLACGLIGGVLLPLAVAARQLTPSGYAWALASFVLILFGELLERHLFFTSAVAPKMPGVVHT